MIILTRILIDTMIVISLKIIQKSLPSRWRAVVNLNGDKVQKMNDTDRKNLPPIPEELNLPEPNSSDSDSSSDFDSNASLDPQYETDTLSQELADNLTG